jgi:hypothetical protein
MDDLLKETVNVGDSGMDAVNGKQKLSVTEQIVALITSKVLLE